MAVAVALALMALTRSSLAGAQAARAAREAKILRKKENEQKGVSYQVVRLCSACACTRPPCRGRRLLTVVCVVAADHRHEEDQEDEQEAAQVDLEDGHNGRQAQGLHQEGEEGCGDGHNKLSADEFSSGQVWTKVKTNSALLIQPNPDL